MTETQKKRHSPLTWVPSAYFAMGMPFVILNMVCVLMFKGLGIEDSQIALWTSVIMFPWTIKFLWSPFLEIFKTKKFFVVTTQLISGVGFGLVALALHLDHFFAISIFRLSVIALDGATHDIDIDGIDTAKLSKTDQAKYIGWQGAFYNLAKLIATGLLVYIAGVLINHYEASGATNQEAALPAWTVIMLACCAILVLLSIWHRIILPSSQKENTAAVRSSSEIMKELGEVIREFFTKKHIWLYIAFIILYRLGGIRHQDCAALPQGRQGRRRPGAQRTADRSLLRVIRSRGLCNRVTPRRILYRAPRPEESALLTRVHFQHSVPGIYIPRMDAA